MRTPSRWGAVARACGWVGAGRGWREGVSARGAEEPYDRIGASGCCYAIICAALNAQQQQIMHPTNRRHAPKTTPNPQHTARRVPPQDPPPHPTHRPNWCVESVQRDSRGSSCSTLTDLIHGIHWGMRSRSSQRDQQTSRGTGTSTSALVGGGGRGGVGWCERLQVSAPQCKRSGMLLVAVVLLPAPVVEPLRHAPLGEAAVADRGGGDAGAGERGLACVRVEGGGCMCEPLLASSPAQALQGQECAHSKACMPATRAMQQKRFWRHPHTETHRLLLAASQCCCVPVVIRRSCAYVVAEGVHRAEGGCMPNNDRRSQLQSFCSYPRCSAALHALMRSPAASMLRNHPAVVLWGCVVCCQCGGKVRRRSLSLVGAARSAACSLSCWLCAGV